MRNRRSKNEEKESAHIRIKDIKCSRYVKIVLKKIYLKKHEYILLRNESKDVIRLRKPMKTKKNKTRREKTKCP